MAVRLVPKITEAQAAPPEGVRAPMPADPGVLDLTDPFALPAAETAAAEGVPAWEFPAAPPPADPAPEAAAAGLARAGGGFAEPVDESCFICEGNEALRILRDVARATTQAQILFDQGRQVLISAVLDVLPESGELILDYGGIESMNRAVMRFSKFIIVTQKDRCRVQFSADRIERTEWEGRDAFSVPLPESVVWVQRREFFRVKVPLGSPLKCWFQFAGERLEADVLDLSLNGVGLAVYGAPEVLDTGAVLASAVFGLPGSPPLSTDLEVRYAYERNATYGKPYLRLGCRFMNLRGDAMRELQRYMNAVERERRMRERDRR